ncbi:MAG: DUF6273 domain-containing protein [Synergistaceae bacterium]|nr:DUF6273 domain-containing protein [Synergistaceae bacterium]
MKKITKFTKSYFNGSARKFLCLGLCVMLVVLTMSSLTPVVSPAEASPSGGIVKITDFTGGNGGGANQAETIYYGSFYQSAAEGYTPPEGGEAFNKNNYEQKGIQWRVLANDTTGSGTKQVFLLSDKALFARQLDNGGAHHECWKDVDIRKVLNGTTGREKTTFKETGEADTWGSFAGDAFSDREHAAIKDTTNSDVSATDKLFFLSEDEALSAAFGFSTDPTVQDPARVAEATDLAQGAQKMYGNTTEMEAGVSGNPASWWLRSGIYSYSAYTLMEDVSLPTGIIAWRAASYDNFAARPAFNLDQSKIAFLTAAQGGKHSQSCGGAFNIDTTYDGSQGWKVTLKDPYDANTDTGIKTPTVAKLEYSDGFDINKMAEVALGQGVKLLNMGNAAQVTGRTYYIKYSGVTTGKNMFVSALLDPDNLGNYAKLASVGTEASKEGVLALNVSNVSGEKNVKFFGEQENGDYMTDYMSDLGEEVSIEGASGHTEIIELSQSEYGDKGLTLNLFNYAKVFLEAGEYNTNVIVDTNNCGALGMSNVISANAVKLTGDIYVGGGNAYLSVDSPVKLSGNLYFNLDGHKKDDSFIEVSSVGKGECDLTGAQVHLMQTEEGSKLAKGEKMILVSQAKNYTGPNKIETTGGLKKYLYSIKIAEYEHPLWGGNFTGLLLGFLEAEASVNTKSFTQARLGSIAAINSAADIVATSLMDSAIPQSNRWEAFAVLGGNRSNYDRVGNNLDLNMFNVAAGVSGKVCDNLTLGLFAEGGNGRYYTENKFVDADVFAKGDINYFGGGLFAKAEGRKTDLGQLHGEASVRVGHINSKYNSSTFDPTAYTSFDMGGTYFGAHAGFGYKWNVKGGSNIDTYVKYLWNRQNSVSATLGNEGIDLDTINSNRLRAGFRYNSNEGKNGFNFFGGLAYEYEFDGKAKGSTDGLAIDTSDFKGGSGLAEFGVKFERKDSPWKGEVALQGFAGQRTGIGANVSVWYMFGK